MIPYLYRSLSVSDRSTHWDLGRFGRLKHKLPIGKLNRTVIINFLYIGICKQPSEPSVLPFPLSPIPCIQCLPWFVPSSCPSRLRGYSPIRTAASHHTPSTSVSSMANPFTAVPSETHKSAISNLNSKILLRFPHALPQMPSYRFH